METCAVSVAVTLSQRMKSMTAMKAAVVRQSLLVSLVHVASEGWPTLTDKSLT